MKKTILKLTTIACSAILMNSCRDKHNEEELITTVKVTLVNAATGATQVAQFADPDGEGGNNFTKFDTIKLSPNTNYTMNLQFLNESETPAEDITTEIVTEGIDHEVFVEPNPSSLATLSGHNKDANGLKLGTTANLLSGAAGIGKLQVILKHKPGIKKSGDNSSVGDTDVELPNGGFVLQVQ